MDHHNPDYLSLEYLINLRPHALESEEVISRLKTKDIGLKEHEVNIRKQIFGFNKLDEKKRYSVFSLFVNQFTNFLILILIFAGLFSFIIGEKVDGIAILTIVLVNGFLGFFQEFKAEKSIEALKKIETQKAKVIRNSQELIIDAIDLVPGDILVIGEGDRIPADARIIESHTFEVDESTLTGESNAVNKEELVLDKDLPLPDRKNMVYSGCLVNKGRAVTVVVLTGMNTEIGKIAKEISQTQDLKTPLQQALERLGKILGIIGLGVVIPSLVLGILTGREWINMVMVSISLAVSAIPEGLPIVVTIALALGIRRMAKVNVLIRRLSSAETLGGVNVICTDKTGTLTHNQMTVAKVFINKIGFFEFDNKNHALFNKIDNVNFNISDIAVLDNHVDNLIKDSVLCSDATFNMGDPTEKALVTLFRNFGKNEIEVRKEIPRKAEIPFNSFQKYMAVVVKKNDQHLAIIKGAPEVILSMCILSNQEKELMVNINDYLSSQGLRVLAVAKKVIDNDSQISDVNNYNFSGFISMYDPPREGVVSAIQTCYKAGIRVIMITGDHKKTAVAIADKIGLQTTDVVTGDQIDKMSEQEFVETVKKINVFARVVPEHKVKILQVLDTLGMQVAMTGDGVNDAPAVKKADIGICVGSGTDLTKSVSDMIILDDNFSTIVKGIKEGRRIFFNIKKFLRFLLSANFDEIAGISTCVILGIPLLLLPLQILWLNLATESIIALSLTSDVAEKGIMLKKPYQPKKEILKGVIPFAVVAGFTAYIATFCIFLISLYVWRLPVDYARTFSFTTTVLFGFFLIFSARSEESAFKIGIFSNKLLWIAIITAFFGQLFAVYHPVGQMIFKTVSLSINDWLWILIFSSSGFIVMEIVKALKARFLFDGTVKIEKNIEEKVCIPA